MLPLKQIEKLLLTNKILSEADVSESQAEAKKQNKDWVEHLYKEKIISEKSLYELYAKSLHVPFISLETLTIRKDILNFLPESIAQTHNVIAFDQTDDKIKIASLDPLDLEIFDFIKKKSGKEPSVYVTSPQMITEALKMYHKGLKATVDEMTHEDDKTQKDSAKGTLKELAKDLPVIRIVDTILEYAIFEDASDIHIEPAENEVIVRYRIDGVLRDAMTLPKQIHSGIVARIKILANLKLDEHRLPQDGRFKIKSKEYKVSFRVSIIPIFDGEKTVLRLLDQSSQILTLEQLGFLANPLKIIKRAVKKPHGMILVTGPTGSGKTTTLYTILNILNNPKVNISTIEDPIEYRMPRINQTQVNPRIGLTFAQGLRSLLRQDPNIIMVGEIRDKETAEIGVHSAMTGHLVLSTLHTNDAVGALPRIQEMGIPPFLVASTTNVIVAQRLVRKVCIHCIESYELTKSNITQLESQLNFKDILSVMEREGIIDSADSPMSSLLFYRGHGCKECNHEGYKGRMGIYEILEINKAMSELIVNQAPPEKLYEEANKQGFISLIQDGFIKAKSGITTIEEVLRVTKD
ncbi:MAG: GspE/PulE family protein [Patescibacteria group bacterium]